MKKNSFWHLSVLMLLGLVFLVSIYQVGYILIRGQKEEAAFVALAREAEIGRKQTGREIEGEGITGEIGEEANDSGTDSYGFLKERNPDFFGWLSIPGTNLDYPVMYTPEEPEYYLRRAFDGSDSQSGVPFVGEGYVKEGRNTIIYGHNMKNGTMFATLYKYAKQSFCEENPVIILETPEGQKEYQVLGAFYSDVYEKAEEGVFRFYQCNDLREPEAFQSYIEQVQAASLYDTGVEAEYGGELLTLATCSYHKEDERFVVVAYCQNGK